MAERVYELRVEVMAADDIEGGTYACLSSIALQAMADADLFVTGFEMRQIDPKERDRA